MEIRVTGVTKFTLSILKPFVDFPFALVEYIFKGKCKGSWRKFKQMSIDEIEKFLDERAKYRKDKHDFTSFAKTVACTLEEDCDGWSNFWYKLIKKQGKAYRVHFKFKGSVGHAGTIYYGEDAFYYFSLWCVHRFKSYDQWLLYIKENYKNLKEIIIYRPIF